MPEKENSVFEPSAEWKSMKRYMRLTRALRGGTDAMRAEFPPKQYPREGDNRYMERVEKTYFLDAFDRAIQGYSDRVLSDGIVLHESTPEWLRVKLETSVDGRGTKLSSWAAPALQAGLSDGISYILTDATSPESGRAKAYWTLHTTETVIGGRVDWSDDGAQLRQVRLKETAERRKGAYGSESVDRVRVIDLDGESGPTWSVWEQDDEGDERLAVDDKGNELIGSWDLDYITLRPFRTDMQNAHRFFYAVPPQMALIGKNVEHWELSSMVSNNRATNLIPIRTFLGIKKEEFDAINALGAGLAVHSEAPASEIEIGLVETTGVPLAEGRNEQERIEKQMEAQALMPLAPQDYGNVTATRDIIASEEMTSSIKQDAVCFEDTLNTATGDLAALEGQEALPKEQIIAIPGKDYAVVNDAGGLERALDTLERVASRIPRELRQVALDHAVLYGVLSKDTDTTELVRELDASSGMGGAGTDQRGRVREALKLIEQGATEDEAIDEVFRPNLAAV